MNIYWLVVIIDKVYRKFENRFKVKGIVVIFVSWFYLYNKSILNIVESWFM